MIVLVIVCFFFDWMKIYETWKSKSRTRKIQYTCWSCNLWFLLRLQKKIVDENNNEELARSHHDLQRTVIFALFYISKVPRWRRNNSETMAKARLIVLWCFPTKIKMRLHCTLYILVKLVETYVMIIF